MAISDMKGTVTTTGMMNQPSKMPQGNVDPKLPQPKSITQTTQEPVVNTQNTTTVQAPTDEDMETINAALSPSVKIALGKVFPDLKSTIDKLGTNEPNVIIPLSVAKRYATSKYGGASPEEALQTFVSDVIKPDYDAFKQQLETQQTNVPPGNQPQGLMTSPQNMETV